MKKLVLAVTMVVLLAAAVFGGQAIASSKPADISISEQTSEEILFDWGSSYRGYPLRMNTLSGTEVLSNLPFTVILDESYSGVRHVSLTIAASGFESNDFVRIDLETGSGPVIIGRIDDTGLYTYEFDTDNWKLGADDEGGFPLYVRYWATITYPSNQW